MNKPKNPEVSIVLPVYNGAQYLAAAIQSVLSQTYTNFELIIIDDGSKDDPRSVVARFTDPRIIFIEQSNCGLATTLNIGIKKAKGQFIARQDQDDLWHPKHLELEVQFLEQHPKCGIVGTSSQIQVGETLTNRLLRHPETNSELQFAVLFDSPFVHSSVLIRREVFDAVGYYTTDPNRQPPEDYELWSRVAREFELANLPDILHIYRETPGSMSRPGNVEFAKRVSRICQENIALLLGREFDDAEVKALAALTHQPTSSSVPLSELFGLVDELARAIYEKYGGDRSSLRRLAEQQKLRLRLHAEHRFIPRLAYTILGKLKRHLY